MDVEDHQLKKQLSNRHIQLIALGGAIGTGLFLGIAADQNHHRRLGKHFGVRMHRLKALHHFSVPADDKVPGLFVHGRRGHDAGFQ